MKIGTLRVGTGTVLPGAKTVNGKSPKSFRASKQAAPTLPPPSEKPARAPRTAFPPPALPAALAAGGAAAEPFILELTVPARPDGRYPVQWHRALPPHDLPQGNCLVVWLRAGEPFRLLVDGRQHFDRADVDWPGGERVTWTIRASLDFAPDAGIQWCENIAFPEQDNFLRIPVAIDEPLEVSRDGQLVLRQPDAAQEGGAQ